MEELAPTAPVPRDTHSGVLGRGTSIMILSTLLLLLLNFVARVVIARGVGTEEWGEFSLALALTGMLGIIAALGLPNAIARAMAFERSGAGRARLVRSATLAAIGSSLVGSVSVFVASGWLAVVLSGPGHQTAQLQLVFQLFSVSVGSIVFSMVLAAFFQGMERAEPNAVFNQIVNPTLFMLFAAAAIFLHLGFVAVLLSYVLSYLIATILLAAYTIRYLPPLLRHSPHDDTPMDSTAQISLFELTLTLFGVASLNLLTQYADTILLAVYRSTEVVGYYTASMTIARLFLVSNSALMYLYLPVSSRLRSTGDMSAVRRSYVTSARWTAATTLPLFMICFFDPKEVLGFAFGKNYLIAAESLQILAIGSLLSVIVGPSPAALAGLGQPRYNMAYGLFSLSANIGLSLALIPSMGLIGASVAWSVARVIYPGLCLLHLAVGYKVDPFESTFVRPVLAASVVLVPVFFILHPIGSVFVWVPLAFLAAFTVTLIAFPVTRSMERGDLAILGVFESAIRVKLPRLRRYLVSRLPAGVVAS
ncbi:MAG: flippase [Thermoplasmata archaeon]|nr:flippase [Thermoplasmata archaeon]